MTVSTEWCVFETVAYARWRTVVESDLQQHRLDENHENGLSEKRKTVKGPEPIKDSAMYRQLRWLRIHAIAPPHFRIDATSMIRGMSREKPSLVLERCIEMI